MAGLTCDGFDHPLKVIFDQACPTISATTRQDRSLTGNKASHHALIPQLPHDSTDSDSESLQNDLTPVSSSPPAELDLLPFEENIQATFLVVNYLSILELGRKSMLPAWGSMDPGHYPSKRALEASYFGRFHRCQKICDIGSMWYGQSLKKLARDLDDPKEMLSLSVLRSAVVLTMYELTSPSSTAWVHHAGGVGRLLEARGPRRHQAVEERTILEAARPIILAKAVAEGKRCFLEAPDWVTVPWELEPGGKSRYEKLFDIACQFPGLIEDRHNLSVQKQRLARGATNNNLQPQPDMNNAYHLVARGLAARCEQCAHQLRIWNKEWDVESSNPESLGTPSLPLAGSDYPYAALGLPLTFNDLRHANHYAMYNSLLCTILAMAYEANYEASTISTDIPSGAINESLFLRPGLPTPRTDHDYLLKERHASAVEICRAVPYHHQSDQHGPRGPYTVMFPLIAAQQAVAPGSEESRYIDRVFPRFTKDTDLERLQSLSPVVRMISLSSLQHLHAYHKAIRPCL
ncbi:MAG: hypothetical protein Q9197_002256 [Variospora fuerteventurae]